MSDTEVRDLLDRLAATAPEPVGDPVAEVYRRLGHHVHRRRRARRGLVPIAVAFATVVALLTAVGVTALVGRDDDPTPLAGPGPQTSDAVVAAARQFAATFFTFDYRDIDAYVGEVEAGSTGQFREDFAARQPDLTSTLTQVQSVATGKVLSIGAREVTPTSARVLAVADQDVTNKTSQGKPVTNRYRMSLEMRLVDGRWLVQGLEPMVGGEPGNCPDPTDTPDRDQLLRQTCAATERLFSFDYRTLEADLAAQRAVTTGTFTNEVEAQTSPAIRIVAARIQAHVEAAASAAAIVRQDGTTATVLVFVDQSVTSRALPAPRVDRNRLEVSMTRVGDRWLVSGVKAL